MQVCVPPPLSLSSLWNVLTPDQSRRVGKSITNNNMGILGNRSSVDESKVSDAEDETTIVEPDQGNGRRPMSP